MIKALYFVSCCAVGSAIGTFMWVTAVVTPKLADLDRALDVQLQINHIQDQRMWYLEHPVEPRVYVPDPTQERRS